MKKACSLEKVKFEDQKYIIKKDFFHRSSAIVAPDLIGTILAKRMPNGEILKGLIVEAEAYCQSEPGCHGFKQKTKRNKTLFGEPGNLYIYLTYGIYHCVNIVTDKSGWASGVLLRAIAIPGEDERIASGPGLLARRFDLNISHDNLPISIENGLWIVKKSASMTELGEIIKTTRIGISKGQDLYLRWYLKSSRSVSRRAKGDKNPPSMNQLRIYRNK
tara:strand:+ start:840 stop:1493 length:654 start_codon:yes stop_codon:yes gene_type:complete